jgi:hypothetical protein
MIQTQKPPREKIRRSRRLAVMIEDFETALAFATLRFDDELQAGLEGICQTFEYCHNRFQNINGCYIHLFKEDFTSPVSIEVFRGTKNTMNAFEARTRAWFGHFKEDGYNVLPVMADFPELVGCQIPHAPILVSYTLQQLPQLAWQVLGQQTVPLPVTIFADVLKNRPPLIVGEIVGNERDFATPELYADAHL